MTQFYVVGGRQKPGVDYTTEEWHHYAAGLVLLVEPETGSLRPCAEYVSPPDACAVQADPSIVFKTATLVGSRLYVPTQTELLTYQLPSFERVGYVSLPCFNDVHHVCPGPEGTLLVANTGLDMVVEVTPEGRVCREWSVIGEELWTRFARDVDYRKAVTTKPHKSHPNHVWFLDGEIWVTRCDQHDAYCLTRPQAPIAIAEDCIHDGLVRGASIYFTVVKGQVVVVDAATREVRRRSDLNAITGGRTPLGWMRGIEVLDDDHVVVGFSRLRPTKWKQNVRWVKHQLGGDGSDLLPTRIAMFDLRRGKLCWELNLEPAGMNVVFSVHRVEPGGPIRQA
jgi:hypothetical protein